jgi:dCTP deaminase
MILNELQITKRMLDEDPKRRIILTPIIDAQQQFGPSSIDLRLGTRFKVAMNTRYTHIDPLSDKENMRRATYTRDVYVGPLKCFVLHPGEFALGSTLEFIRLPHDIAARLEGRSTWGRLGLQIHSTAGFVDPGFRGALTFELQNAGKVPISLYAGMRVAQISFYESKESQLPYGRKKYAKYSDKMGTVGSKYDEDPEFTMFRKLKKEKLR